MLPNLSQRHQLVRTALEYQSALGKRFKPDTVREAIVDSLWARDPNELVGIMSSSMDKNEIPQGIEMPWGRTIKQ